MRRVEILVLCVLVALFVVPVWLAPTFPSQDGPAHLYNAAALWELLTNPSSPQHEFLEINRSVWTNWPVQLLLGLLLHWVAPVTAEKLLVTLVIAALAAGFVYAAGALIRENRFVAIAATPLLSTYLLHMGFYGFLLATALLLGVLGFWLRRDGFLTGRETALLALLLALLYSLHTMALLATMLALGLMTLTATAGAPGWSRFLRRAGPLAAAGVPAVVLLAHDAAVMGRAESTAWFPGRQFLNLIATHNPLVSFSQWEFFSGMLASLLIATFAAHRIATRRRAGFGLRAIDGMLPLAAVCVFFAFAVPDFFSSGSVIVPRFLYFAYIGLWLMCGSWGYTAEDRRSVVIMAAGVALLHAAALLPNYQRLAPALRDFASLASAVEPGARLVALRFLNHVPSGGAGVVPRRIDTFLHYDALLALERGALWVNNYQARTVHFPIRFRSGNTPVELRESEEIPCPDLALYEKQAGPLDYLLLWEYPAEAGDKCTARVFKYLEDRAAEVVSTSPGGRGRLYRLSREGTPDARPLQAQHGSTPLPGGGL